MAAPTLPASLCLRCVVDLIAARHRRLAWRVARGSTARAEGRRREMRRLLDMEHALQSLHVAGEVRADVAGLLLALAAGHLEAMAELEAIDTRLERFQADDVVGACRALLGTRE